MLYPTRSKSGTLPSKTGLVVSAVTVSRIMRGHVMAPLLPLSNRSTDIRPGCNTQRIAPTPRLDESRNRLGMLSHQRNYNVFPICCQRCSRIRKMLPPVWFQP
ncbi:hypothetical protein PoB_001576600 [Plakobranchus ocellatus]|uniref:Uncharacterized protein n=1 Tax=Plakobranchus ocellatus TaxID=259542 RepID=A0AAV3Z3V8_9GAST|nr:hypothetical protein PoB_001576600 [Plakobranchus ocellatus]